MWGMYSYQCINRCDLPVVPWYYSGIGTTGIGHTTLAEMGALYWNVTCWIVDSLLICSAVTASLVRTNLFIQYWDASSTFSQWHLFWGWRKCWWRHTLMYLPYCILYQIEPTNKSRIIVYSGNKILFIIILTAHTEARMGLGVRAPSSTICQL